MAANAIAFLLTYPDWSPILLAQCQNKTSVSLLTRKTRRRGRYSVTTARVVDLSSFTPRWRGRRKRAQPITCGWSLGVLSVRRKSASVLRGSYSQTALTFAFVPLLRDGLR